MTNDSIALQLQMYFNIRLTPADLVRLGSNLNSWSHLNELLVLDQFSLEDLKKLLTLEVVGKQRKQVLTNLTSKIKTKETKHVQSIIAQCLHRKENSSSSS